MPFPVPFVLTLTWDIDILFEMLTPEKGDEFEKHPLHCASRGIENYLFCLVIVFIFVGLEGAKR